MWDKITYLFPDFNDVVAKVWEWIHIFISHITGRVIIYLWLKLIYVSKRAPVAKTNIT